MQQPLSTLPRILFQLQLEESFHRYYISHKKQINFILYIFILNLDDFYLVISMHLHASMGSLPCTLYQLQLKGLLR